MVLSVPGEVLCSRRVLVLLVTFDLWLSLCVGLFLVCVFVWVLGAFFFFCRCCGGFASAGLLDLGWAGVPGRAYPTGGETACQLTFFCTCPFLCHLVPLSLGFARGSRAWVGGVAESVKLGAVLGPHAASTSTTSGPGWWHCRDQGVTVGAHGAASYLSLAVFLLASALFL